MDKSATCGNCGKSVERLDKAISIINNKTKTITVFHKDYKGCSRARGYNSIGNLELPSRLDNQLATLSLSRWEE